MNNNLDLQDIPSENNSSSYYPPNETPCREGSDDALVETSPTDYKADEKVIANKERENEDINLLLKLQRTSGGLSDKDTFNKE